jgi:hypothetical protein
MTIRYICAGCESVLKIKDEKAGTRGRCPKCKAEFDVPFSTNDEGTEGTGRSATKSVAPVDEIDMPLELTPEVEDHPDFDPSDVLSPSIAQARTASSESGPGTAGKKPSIAELMRDFEAGKKKGRKKESQSEIHSQAVTPTAVKTVGTATDALSRAYQQKREAANQPTVSVKDAKAAEQRALFFQFLLKKAVPLSAAVILLLSGYYWYMTRDVYHGVPLYPVTGKLISQSGAVEGLRVMFLPVSSGIDDQRSSAEGVVGADGSFFLVYFEPHQGAPAGKYDVLVFATSGMPVMLAGGTPMLTVSDTETNYFELKL